jgi:hypothetical protein
MFGVKEERYKLKDKSLNAKEINMYGHFKLVSLDIFIRIFLKKKITAAIQLITTFLKKAINYHDIFENSSDQRRKSG